MPASAGGIGLSATDMSWFIIAMQIGMWFGYVTFGFISDTIGRKRAYVGYLLTAAVLILVYTSLRTPIALLLLGPFVAFFATGYFSGFGAVTAEIYPTDIRATAQGFTYNIGRIASAVGAVRRRHARADARLRCGAVDDGDRVRAGGRDVDLDSRDARTRARMTRAIVSAAGRTIALAWMACGAAGCLVLSLNPAYDDSTIAWEPRLVGAWQSPDDRSSIRIDRGEWQSYRLHYEHPIETGDLTAYLTIVGNDRYLDVMPARGQDHGSFLVPVHAVLRVRLDGDTLELTPLSYDWFSDRLRTALPIAGLDTTLDQKENALIVSSSGRVRDWLRTQTSASPAFGAPATFVRKPVKAEPGRQ